MKQFKKTLRIVALRKLATQEYTVLTTLGLLFASHIKDLVPKMMETTPIGTFKNDLTKACSLKKKTSKNAT